MPNFLSKLVKRLRHTQDRSDSSRSQSASVKHNSVSDRESLAANVTVIPPSPLVLTHNEKEEAVSPKKTLSRSSSSHSLASRNSNKDVELPPPPIPPAETPTQIRHQTSNISLKSVVTSAHTHAAIPPDLRHTTQEENEKPSVSMTPITESPTALTTPEVPPIVPESNGRSLSLSPPRDSDAILISSVSPSITPSKDKKRPRKQSNPTSKPSGLASAIATSGLVMANSGAYAAQPSPPAASLSAVSRRSSVPTSPLSPPAMNHTPSGSLTIKKNGRRRGTSPHSSKPKRLKTSSPQRRTSISVHSDASSEYFADVPDYYSDLKDHSSDESDADSLGRDDLDLEENAVKSFAVASYKRNSDFHELFPNVPETDYLIEDYGCNLQREILIQGRLYISENYICFHANIFGWVTDLSIPIAEIESLEKKMMAFVIPNVIQIKTRQARHSFASFLSRDTTFDVIYNIWRLVRSGVGSVSPRGSIDVSTNGGGGSSTAIMGGLKPKKTQCACLKDGAHFSETALDTIIPGTPDRIYNLIFMSGFIKEFFSVNQKFLDIQISDWAPTPPTFKLLTRNMSYIKPLNASIGPKQTKCEIKDETVHLNYDEYISTITTMRTPDVLSGGVFVVMTRTCVMWASAVSTRVVVTTQVDWSGMSSIKGIIERSSIDDQKTYYAALEREMRVYIAKSPNEFIPEGFNGLLPSIEPQVDTDEIYHAKKEEPQSTSIVERVSATAPAIEPPGFAQWKAVASHLHFILLKKDLYKLLLSQTGDQAQSLLNLLHQLLDLPDLAPRTRSDFLMALDRLSKKTGLYPECLVLTGLDKVGEHPVAAGSFGEVWQGVIREREVSVKVVRVYLRDDAEKLLKAFYHEAILWSQLDHPNILPLYGIYFLDDIRSRLCLVSPWMHHGNLSHYVRNVPDADYSTLLLDIARGLEYLHQNKIAHADLKGVNILVTPSARACIMDFGLSTIADSYILNWTSLASSSGRGGSVRWQAPEILNGDTQGSFAGDVYAYACVCYEIFSGIHPFSEFPNDYTVMFRVISGTRPNRPSSNLLSEQMWQLMQDCWQADPTKRPTITEVVTRISTLPEGMDVEPARNDWDKSFPRFLRKSLRGETLSLTLEELRAMFPGADDGD